MNRNIVIAARLLFVYYVFWLTNAVLIKKPIIARLRNVTFDVNPDYFRVKYSLRSNPDGSVKCDATVAILQNSTGADMFIQHSVFKKDRTGKFETMINGKRWNICSYFKKPQLDPFMKVATDAINFSGNQLNSCPVVQMEFNITGITMDGRNLTSFTPPGNYFSILQYSKKIMGKYYNMYTANSYFDVAWK